MHTLAKERGRGITPAYAGKSHGKLHRLPASQDHPRIRGEKEPIPYSMSGEIGSPPHTRGKGDVPVQRGGGQGITPAYAGKSRIFTSSVALIWDHPRIRGEKMNFPPITSTALGSPPHTRGKAVRFCHICASRRITPAYAGKSSWSCVGVNHNEDHPRIRGEKYGKGYTYLAEEGSPPHTRGKDTVRSIKTVHLRITPAYAGKRTEH